VKHRPKQQPGAQQKEKENQEQEVSNDAHEAPLDRLAFRMTATTDDVRSVSFPFAPRAAVLTVLLRLAATAGMCAFLALFHGASWQLDRKPPNLFHCCSVRAPNVTLKCDSSCTVGARIAQTLWRYRRRGRRFV
jgi:hypothetical protein